MEINNENVNVDKLLEFNFLSIGNFSFGLLDIFQIIIVLFIARILISLLKLFVQKTSADSEIDQGTQFVIIQLLKYAIYIFASVIILNIFGVNFTLLLGSSAALLVGIGFGLQDLFKDIISGFILLFEGTTKVGDIIEIPNTSRIGSSSENMVAKVLKINIRTTKIETREGNTLIIPNATLTREYVNNWSYSNKLTRFSINFSVDYSSDLDEVKKIVEEAVSSHPLVQGKKKVHARVLNFGDNGVDMDVLFYADHTWRIELKKSDIRYEISRVFKREGIVIPFPQRVITYADTNKDPETDRNPSE